MRTFKHEVQSGFAVTANIHLQPGEGFAAVRHQAELLSGSVCAIHVPEEGDSMGGLSTLAASTILHRSGMDAIPELNCHNRNRIALTSDLLGLRALGVTSLVVNQEPENHEKRRDVAKKVNELDCQALIELAATLNEDCSGPGEEFLIGTETEALSPNPHWDGTELKKMASSGAQFLQLPLCLDLDCLRIFMKKLVDKQLTWSLATMVTLAPLPSSAAGRRLLEAETGCLIPPHILERLELATDPEQEGIEICAELIREASSIPGVNGIRLLTLGNPGNSVISLTRSGIQP